MHKVLHRWGSACDAVARRLNPQHGWRSRTVHLSHGRHMLGERYAAVLHHPPDWVWEIDAPLPVRGFKPVEKELLQKAAELYSALLKANGAEEGEGRHADWHSIPGARWITVHPNGDEEEGHPVLIVPNDDGTHTILGGAGGKLNGMRLSAVKSPEEYRHLAKQRRAEKARQQKMQEDAERLRLGQEEFGRQQAERDAAKTEAKQARYDAEREFVSTVAKAQGIDSSFFDLPKDALAGVKPNIANRIVEKNHQAAVSWAKRVTEKVKDIVTTAYDDLSADTLAQIGVADVARESMGDTGKGYQAHLKAMAEDAGLTDAKAARQREEVSWRRFLERSDYDLKAARAKQQAVENRTAAKSRSDAEVKRTAQELQQQGAGPEAAKSLVDTPNVQNIGEAMDVLRAARKMEAAQEAEKGFNRQLEEVRDAGKLPKAAVVVASATKENPESADQAIASKFAMSLDEREQMHAMNALVQASNDIERAHGTLREHYSVGQALTFNTVLQAVDGTTVDPLVGDILGAAGMAQVIASRWKQNMAPEEYDAVRGALADHHVATQVGIADKAVADAHALMDEADAYVDFQPENADELQAAIEQHAEKTEVIRKARQALGVARGRLEAAAALNHALMQTRDVPCLVSLGARGTRDAMADMAAIGLTDHSEYDPATNDKTREGEFSLWSDGENTIAEIHSAGLAKLARPADPGKVERAKRSAAIKSGQEDQEGWLPAGLSDRPATDFDVDPLQKHSIDHVLTIGEADSPETIRQKIRQHIAGLLADGRSVQQAHEDVWAESTAADQNLSPAQRDAFDQALTEVAPQFIVPAGADFSKPEMQGAYDTYQKEQDARFQGYLDDFVTAKGRKGKAIDRQRIPMDKTAQDSLYVAALANPDTRYAFTPLGDLDREGKAAIRRYALRTFLGAGPGKDGTGDDEIITPVSDEEEGAFRKWQDLGAAHGDPYQAIQQDWAERSAGAADLFGEVSEAHPFASVDLSDQAAVLAVARQHAGALGYRYQLDPKTGEHHFPDLVAGTTEQATGAGQTVDTKTAARSDETIYREARIRIRGALRDHWLREMAGHSRLADEGFNPESIKTASERWTEYVRDMGGERSAIRATQEMMAGELSQQFANQYEQRTGHKLKLISREIENAHRHAEASMTPEQRARVRSAMAKEMDVAAARTAGGQYREGSKKGAVETQRAAKASGRKLFATGERGEYGANVERASLGAAAEASLKAMMPYIQANRPQHAAANITMSGKAVNRQRAVKLIEQNERQGLNLQAGSGKTSVGLGAFTDLHSQGKAKRALYVVPSNIVGQFGSEWAGFVDPSSGLRAYANPRASADDRRTAYANPDWHAVVVTPESLREDVTAAVAEDKGWSPSETVDHLAGMSESDRDSLIHAAMDKRGWNFDYSMFDESHRLLGRQGKPDAHMARVGDSVGRYTRYYTYSTADPVKNDVSEAWDILHKIDPQRYGEGTRDAFMRKFGRGSLAAGLALQREMEPYMFAAPVDMGVESTRHPARPLALTAEQAADYKTVMQAWMKAKAAKARGETDMDALRVLSPRSFAAAAKTGLSEEEIAGRLNRGLATLRETALNRVVNIHPNGAKLNFVSQYAGQHAGEPMVVFAHNLESVKQISERLRAEGHRVGVLTGGMSSDAKDRAKLAFNPPNPDDAQADILVSSDAGAVGANLQRGMHLINVDVPLTAMLHEQRIAREVRTGQLNHVQIHDLVADAGFDRRNRKRLERKSQLRELMTTPAEMIDDSGLAYRIHEARSNAFEEQYAHPQEFLNAAG